MSETLRPRLPFLVRGGLALAALLPAAAGCDDPFDPDGRRSAPRIELSAPTAGLAVESDSTVVEGTAFDAQGVERVAFRLNGGAEQPVAITPGRSVAFRFVARELKLGANELEVVAYDAAEHAGSGKVSFSTRDVVAPVLEVTSPAAGELVGRDSVRITGRARDDRGVASLAYSLDGAAEVSVPITAGKEVDFDFAVRGTSPGDHTLLLRTKDVAGAEATGTLRFTSGSADLWLTGPATGETVSRFVATLRGVIDSPVQTTRFTYSVNGGPEVAMCAPQGIDRPALCVGFQPGRSGFSWSADALPQGEVRVRVVAYAADRAVAAATVDFRVSVPVRRYRVAQVIQRAGWYVSATALNNRGQVAGYVSDFSTTPSRTRPFFWANGVMADIDHDVYTPAPLFLNDAGQVAGTELQRVVPAPAIPCRGAFLWVPGQAWNSRPCGSEARGLNEKGNVLVNAAGEKILEEAHLWSASQGTMVPFDPGDHTAAIGIGLNDSDVAAARLYRVGDATGPRVALVRTDRSPEVIFQNDANPCGATLLAFDDPADFVCGAGIYRNGQLTTPPPLGVGSPFVTAVNRQRETIGVYFWRAGRSSRDPGESRAFYWAGGTTYDLVIDDPGWAMGPGSWGRPIDINDAGMILATAFNTTLNQVHTVLLTPVP